MRDTELRSTQMIHLTADHAGQRADNYLQSYLKGVPKSLVYRILRKGEARINKKRVKPGYRLQTGDILRLPPLKLPERGVKTVPAATLRKVVALKECCLYEDDSLLVLNKPSGTAVHGGSGITVGLIEALRLLRPELHFIELVHRLDRDTSGILLVAKKRSALRALHEQLRMGEVKKSYLALVHGDWPMGMDTILAPLLKRNFPGGGRLIKVDPLGKPSETRFTVLERFKWATLLEVNLITGRTHQIRVHTQYAGHPIIGDLRYNRFTIPQLENWSGVDRLFLHSSTICFSHPQSGQKVSFKAPLSSGLKRSILDMRAVCGHNSPSEVQIEGL